jgi:hypothetical protein
MEDLQITRPIQHIRRNPAMYVGGLEAPKGEFLAARIISDLVWLRALPAEVIEIDGWWVVRSSVDWPASGSSNYTTDDASRREFIGAGTRHRIHASGGLALGCCLR